MKKEACIWHPSLTSDQNSSKKKDLYWVHAPILHCVENVQELGKDSIDAIE